MEREVQKMDRRVRKTKLAIHTALLELMKDKNINDITVIELTEKADINRKTFYNHYSDIHSVLDELENESVNHLIGVMRSCSFDEFIQNPSRFFEVMISEFKNNIDFYSLLNHSGEHSRLIRKVVDGEKDFLTEMVNKEHSVDPLWIEYYLNFVAGGISEVINHWFMTGQDISIEKLSRFFVDLFTTDDVRNYIKATAKNS